jgi:hypothetical protein
MWMLLIGWMAFLVRVHWVLRVLRYVCRAIALGVAQVMAAADNEQAS